VFSGYVTGITSFGLFVELEDYFVEGLVHISTLMDDYYHVNEKRHTLRGEATGRIFRLGDHLDVRVARVDLERRRIDFAIESPSPPRTTRRTRPEPERGRQAKRPFARPRKRKRK
jgi:ribonuclease R